MSTVYGRLQGTLFDHGFVASLRVAVVGVGALGNEIVKVLGLAGVGEVLLIDHDRVEASNLTRSVLFREGARMGESKPEAAVRAAGRWFPDTRWVPLSAEIADVGWGWLRGCHVILGAVDRDSARLETARVATRLGIPVCDGGLRADGWGVRVSWLPGGGGACFGCRLRSDVRREMLQTWSSTAHPCAAGAAGEDGSRATTPSMASVGGGLQVELALRWLSQKEGEAKSVELAMDPAPRAEAVRVPWNEECPFHHARADETWVECGGNFDSMLAEGERARWEWPICLRARCLECGQEWEPRTRTARIGGTAACTACGSDRALPLESVSEVVQGTKLAALRPEEIGLPARHLYRIRKG